VATRKARHCAQAKFKAAEVEVGGTGKTQGGLGFCDFMEHHFLR